ncbi:MAG: J domain-containing protein [Vicinamibacterales bacterium]
METAPAFSDVLDAKLHAAGFEAVGKSHTPFESTSWSARPAVTQPLTPSAFEVDSAARIAYRFGASAFHADRGATTGDARPTRPSPPRQPLRFDTPAQRAALATLRSLGATDLGPGSDVRDLKRAFRALARQLHPDSLVNVPDTRRVRHAALFAEAAQAYRVLTEERR